MTIASKQELREEALKVMRELGVYGEVRKGIAHENPTLFYSERQNQWFDSVLYWVDNEQRFVEAFKKAEKALDGFAFHATLSHTEMGDLLSVLVIPSDKALWPTFERNLREGITCAWVENLDCPLFSEAGDIGVKLGNMGGLVRIA